MGNQHSYWDHPEGEQCLYKTAVVSKYTGAAGLSLWWYDVVMYSRCRNAGEALARLPLWMVPALACTGTFVMTSCLLNQAKPRQKDAVNFMAAGVATGCVLGACKRSGFTAFNASLVFGLSSFVLRDLHNHGVQFYEWDKYAPTISKFEGLHDYTLREDRPPYTGWEWK